MGCNVCGSAVQEPQISYEDENAFKIKFKEKLDNFGEYITEEEFNSLIPKEILDYMEKNKFRIKSNNSKDHPNYKIEPVQFKNGNIYEGNWNKDFKLDGPGKYYLKDDKVLAEGNWEDGELKYARVFLPNGDLYEGEIKDSLYNGKGKLITTNKDIYEGEFVDGEKTGIGKIVFSDGTIYEGNLNNGEFKGKGKMIWKNGYEYIGDFNGPLLNGVGTLKGPNGDIYEGDFENNLFHGKGKYNFYESGNEYIGDFQYGIKKGKGTYKVKKKYIFDGNWDNDLPCGFGKLSNYDKTAILKCTWRFGKIAEEPIYESGDENVFNSIDKNIEPEKMSLSTKGLPHLDTVDKESTQYQIGNFPSFLQE